MSYMYNAPLPIRHNNGQIQSQLRPTPHQGLHAQHIRNINMPRRLQRRRRMIRTNRTLQLAPMMRAPVQVGIHRKLVLADDRHTHLRDALLPARAIRPRAEDGRLLEGDLEPAQDDGVEGVRFERGYDGDAVAWAVACVGTVDDEGDAVLGDLAGLGLAVDGPGGVEVVFVDYDGR